MSVRKRFSVRELVPQPQRVYTTDAARPIRDTRLSAETGAYNPNMMGRAWQGYSVAQLDAMDDSAVVAAVRGTVDACKRYMRDRLAARGRDGDYAQTTSNSDSVAMGPCSTITRTEENCGMFSARTRAAAIAFGSGCSQIGRAHV